MANTVAALVRIVRPIANSSFTLIGTRNLYARATLGLDNFLQQKKAIDNQFSNMSERFRDKMNEASTPESKSMVFTEDLKNMIHLANNDNDVQLVIQMLKKFNQQNKQLRFGSYIFGPVLMRMFYNLNKPKEALECFKDPNLTLLFDQLISFQILLDLLYENKQYNEMLEVFQLIKNKQIEGIKFVKNVVVLTFAACYKLNTPESLDFALKLWSDLNASGHRPMRRAITFCAGLALNQGRPEVCLEILASSGNSTYVTIRNMKVLSLIELGRIEDVIPILKLVLNVDSASVGPKHTFNKDVLEKVRAAIEKHPSAEIRTEFERVDKYMNEEEHITDESLDEQICQEIAAPAEKNKQFNQRYPNKPFNKYRQRSEYSNIIDPRRTESVAFKRPGLYDLK